MADVELVIKIPETVKEVIDNYGDINWIDASYLIYAIRKGTPLPKGHGNLIDTKEITAFRELECNGHNVESLSEFTVIIGADKENE